MNSHLDKNPQNPEHTSTNPELNTVPAVNELLEAYQQNGAEIQRHIALADKDGKRYDIAFAATSHNGQEKVKPVVITEVDGLTQEVPVIETTAFPGAEDWVVFTGSNDELRARYLQASFADDVYEGNGFYGSGYPSTKPNEATDLMDKQRAMGNEGESVEGYAVIRLAKDEQNSEVFPIPADPSLINEEEGLK